MIKTEKLPWDQYTSEKIYSGKPGVYFLNKQVEYFAKLYPCGFYQFTTEPAYKTNEFKCGQTKRYAAERVHEEREAGEREIYVIVGWIPSKLARKKSEDQRILRKMHNRKDCTLSKVLNEDLTTKEWAHFPNGNPEEVWRDYLGNYAQKFDLSLTIWQLEALDQIFSFLGEGKKKIMAELAARFGKTLLYLSMLLIVKQKVMVVGTYYLTALSSFKKEVSLYNEFSNMVVLDLGSETFQTDFNYNLSQDKKIVVLSSLCGDKENDTAIRNQNARFIETFADKITVIDEADYGAHTPSCVPFVNRIGHGAPVILTTGTNTERARGDHENLDAFLRITYLDQIMKAGTIAKIMNPVVRGIKRAFEFEKNLAKIRFYRYDWSRFVSVLDGGDVELNPSFAKVIKDVQKSHGFWSGLYQSLIGENSDVDANDYSLFNCLEGDSPKSVAQFLPSNMTKTQMKKLGKIANAVLSPFYDVYVINGDEVDGKNAEQFVKDKIRIAEMNGRHVWIIATQMCQRSFSIPEINVVLLTYDNGDLGATIQKMSRALTAGDEEKIGHIISLSIDGNRDDKITPMILDAARKLAEHEDIDIVTALKKVMKTTPIFQMGKDGYNMQLDPDDYSREIFSSSNSHRIVINNDRLMYEGFLDTIGCDASSPIENATASVAFKGGKTFVPLQSDNSVNKTQKDEEQQLFDERRSKLNNILDRSVYCLKEIRKNEGKINYNKFVNILNTNQFVSSTIGVNGDQFEKLVRDKYIDSSLLPMYVECVN
jgi:hypothetical protein